MIKKRLDYDDDLKTIALLSSFSIDQNFAYRILAPNILDFNHFLPLNTCIEVINRVKLKAKNTDYSAF